MTQEYEEKDVHVLLDFQGKDTSRFLKQPGMYFRMLNLNEAKPIIEIGEDIYEGTYDDVVGTNVYFEEVDNPVQNTNVFEGTTPITLEYLLKQTKVLKMKKVGVKPKPVVDTNPTECVNIHIRDDYRALLEKFENGTLNIEECITVEGDLDELEESDVVSDENEEEEQVERKWESSKLPARQTLEPEWFALAQAGSKSTRATEEQHPTSSSNLTYSKYIKLQKLAERPTRHRINPETVANNQFEQPLRSVPKNDFIVWKNLIMRRLEQQPVNLDLNKDKMEDFVDVERSIETGIIAASNQTPRVFSKEEKRELLSFKNFINIAPLMKLIMLQDFVRLERAAMADMTAVELAEVGQDGCTVTERYKLLKDFKEELRQHMVMRLQDESQDESNDNLEFSLSNDELSDADLSYSSDDEDNAIKSCTSNKESTSNDVEMEEKINMAPSGGVSPKSDNTDSKTSNRNIDRTDKEEAMHEVTLV